LVAWRLVGLAEMAIAFPATFHPLRKILMTGLSVCANGCARVV